MMYDPVPTKRIIDHLRHSVRSRTPSSAPIAENVRLASCETCLDFATFGGLFTGHLIIGDFDKFTLTEDEVEAYHLVFDEMHVVCGGEHVDAAKQQIAAEWVIWRPEQSSDGTVTIISEFRGSRMVPESPSRVRRRGHRDTRLNLASLLPHDHAVAALEAAGEGLGVAEALDRIVDAYAFDEIRDLVRASFALRYPLGGRPVWYPPKEGIV